MITEDYCSYEVAKLLKEKGFDEPCFYYYKDGVLMFSPFLKGRNSYHTDTYSAPTHQMAMKWLREVHKLTFIISPQWVEGDMRNPYRWYWEVKGLKDITTDVYSNPLCDSYEEAVEAALKYSLENLI